MNREELKKYHKDNNYSCVLLKDGQAYMTSFEKGVAPLYNLIKSADKLPQGNIEIADKIIGRAVAFLAIYLNASYIYTNVISETALDVLKNYDIEIEYNEVVPYIFNRNRDGQCPMEKALENISDSEDAFKIIDEFKQRTMKKN